MNRKRSIGLLMVLSIIITGAIVTQAQETPDKKLNINIATLDELKALPGITPETAQAILKNRPYQTLEDLLKVSGITDETLANLKDIIEVKKISINTATVSELQALPGITPEMAEAIIEGRQYKIVQELLKIKGIGEKQLKELQGFIEAKPKEEGEDDEKKGWKIRKKNP